MTFFIKILNSNMLVLQPHIETDFQSGTGTEKLPFRTPLWPWEPFGENHGLLPNYQNFFKTFSLISRVGICKHYTF